MYLTYLNHYNIRQCRAQYLNMLYCMLKSSLDSYFILSEEYLQKYTHPKRWEVTKALEHFKTEKALYKKLGEMKYSIMKRPEQLIDESVPSKILQRTVNEMIPEEVKVIEEVLRHNEIEAGITWVNNKCFRETLKKHNIPTIHHEMGPFRPDSYVNTFYFDFSGVNGGTEFDSRFKEFLKIASQVPILSREQLIKILSPHDHKRLIDILHNHKREYKAGVGLQVEVDTNLLLFNNGCSWIDPVLQAQAENSGKILVRPHPAAKYTLKYAGRIVVDDILKGDAVEFINKCDKIYCLNSSVGLEAILLGRRANILGESPFSLICDMDEDTQLKALNFAVFGYLMYGSYLYDDEYYKFRIKNKGDEKKIYLDNMKKFIEKAK